MLPFRNSAHREKDVLGLIHSDICGPMSSDSIGGAKYFVTFTDDYSRYTETITLRNRSDVLEAFKNYKRKVEKQTGRVIKKIRTDNGKEYLSNVFKKFLKEEGIRTIVEMARCLMLQGNFTSSLWAEAVNTATYIRNRCPTKALNGKTPFEMWSGRKPYVGYFKIIGAKAIVLNIMQKRGKFQLKGDQYVLIGHSDESKRIDFGNQEQKL